MNYFTILHELVEKQASSLSQEDYEGFKGIADDAEDDSGIDKCISDYLKTLAADQGCEIGEVSLENADCNDLMDLVMSE